ncbi:MAG: DUF3795 domain-containing protein [Candidatus Neomarinimicrobiota bacterium]
MSIEAIGCCGAYCGRCPELREGRCRGCKLGYADGSRDLSKARCRMKVCCLTKALASCADCGEYQSCAALNSFLGKNGYKYQKYRQALEFIRTNGYAEFLAIADGWTRQYGRYR